MNTITRSYKQWSKKIKMIGRVIKADNKQLDKLINVIEQPTQGSKQTINKQVPHKVVVLSKNEHWLFVIQHPESVPEDRDILLVDELRETFLTAPLKQMHVDENGNLDT